MAAAGSSTVKAATAAMVLLAMVVVATAGAMPMSPLDDIDRHQPSTVRWKKTTTAAGGTVRRHGSGGHHHSHDNDAGDGGQSPLTKLTLCATNCGSEVTACTINCYKPLAKGNAGPVTMPLCLLACTTQVMSCASRCPSAMVN